MQGAPGAARAGREEWVNRPMTLAEESATVQKRATIGDLT